MNVFQAEANKAYFSIPLHAMRGIAAMIVFILHVQTRVSNDIAGIDLKVPFNGGAAVSFFYVLSGLVIGISILRAGNTLSDQISYGIRRAFRILPLMLVTVTAGGAYLVYVDPYVTYKWLPDSYGDFSVGKFLAGYIGYSLKPNPPSWSIFVELVASAALPIMVMMGQSGGRVIAVGLLLLVFGCFNLGLQHHWNFYMINFFLGLSILAWGRGFGEKISKLSTVSFWSLTFGLLIFFYLPRLVFKSEYGNPVFNLIEVAGIIPFVAIVYFCPERFVFLKAKFFRFLGDISFSLYLTHFVVIASIFNLLAVWDPALTRDPVMMWLMMMGICIPVCLGIASLTYQFIELPGIEIGRAVASSIKSFQLRAKVRSIPLQNNFTNSAKRGRFSPQGLVNRLHFGAV